MKVSNILDEYHPTLDERVFDTPETPEPILKPGHREWIREKIYEVLEKEGYTNPIEWLTLFLTGSLTTHQYSDNSDFDISLFINSEHLPEWSRAEMIGIMVNHLDGIKLPGTPFPLQDYVVGNKIKPEDIYKPGLRSAYSIDSNSWFVPPEDVFRDPKTTENAWYVTALQAADKMETLLRYEPSKAILYWNQIHNRRRREQKEGKGDLSEANLIYKMFNQRDLFPQLEDLTGTYIA